ncbi:MAG TPA: glycosyltransferase family 2 protein [Planctomycetota bacterium]|nr:glycosyltransferase family 2 protein [Planctomycetota bacterium]
MKLVIQIPCFNEEEVLPQTLADLPRQIDGVDEIEVLIVDDGSTDRTVEVAREHGVQHIIRLTSNQGLARGFATGLDEALKLGADVIVNTDADNQYSGSSIADLIRPILEGRADLVVGNRCIETIEHFSWLKKRLQKLGSWVVRRLSDTDVPDATSGFRAYSRDAALRLNIVSPFSYTLETIIQAGKKGMAVTHVPIETNPQTRESRLFTSTWQFIKRQAATILRMYVMYEPLKTFVYLSMVPLVVALFLGVRFLWYHMSRGGAAGHVQSLIVMAVLFMLSFLLIVLGILADLIYNSRRLTEDALYKTRLMELEQREREKSGRG